MLQSFEKNDVLNRKDGVKKTIEQELFTTEDEYSISYNSFKKDFYSDDYEKFDTIIERLIAEKEFATISDYAQRLLVDAGVTEANGLDVVDPVVALALTEAVNLAAKEVDYTFYRIKPAMIIAAWKTGAQFGFNNDDGTYSLFHTDIGTASFHDPDGEVEWLVESVLGEDIPQWPYEWSGIYRQDQAFDILQDLKNTEGLIAEMIRSTTPVELKGSGIEFHDHTDGDVHDSLEEYYGAGALQVKLRDAILTSERKALDTLLEQLSERKRNP